MAARTAPAKATGRPLWLFALFAVYGPSLNFLGEFRYVEIVVLLLFLLNIGRGFKWIGPLERRLAALFLLAAFSHIISDLLNSAAVEETIKRAGTYVILAVIVLALGWLSRGHPVRIQWMVLGYCASYVFILFAGQTYSAAYEDDPFRLGLGTAMTIALCVLIQMFPRYERYAGPALLAMAVLHAVLLARSTAAVTVLAGILAFSASLRRTRAPQRFRPDVLILVTIVFALLTSTVYFGAKMATEAKLFPEELQARMELQFANPYGLMAAGRPDVFAGAYAAWKRPLLGYGTTNVDPEVFAFFTEVAASTYIWSTEYTETIDALWLKQEGRGTPSHSHLFGAWADAGVFAALCWLVVLSLCGYVATRVMLWRDPRAPLFLFIALTTAWDILFSPGMHRMDIAIRMMILVYATRLLKAWDVKPISVKRGAGSGNEWAHRFR